MPLGTDEALAKHHAHQGEEEMDPLAELEVDSCPDHGLSTATCVRRTPSRAVEPFSTAVTSMFAWSGAAYRSSKYAGFCTWGGTKVRCSAIH